MIVLALDSTTPQGSVALACGGALMEVRASVPGRGFSEQLPALLLDLVADHGLRIREVDVFAVSSGPGSLTGLRVGIATIQGLALAGGRPVVAVSALEALARSGAKASDRRAHERWIGAWMDARRAEVFSALYAVRPGGPGMPQEREGPRAGPPRVTIERWTAMIGDAGLIVIGDGVEATAALWHEALSTRARLVPQPLLAGAVARIATERAALGQATLPHAVRPLYVRRPDAELARERTARAVPAGSPPAPPRATTRRGSGGEP